MTRKARVALLQLPAFSIEQAADSLAQTLARIDEAAREHPDIIALPEVTYPGYFMASNSPAIAGPTPAEAAERIAAKAQEHGLYIAAGLALDAQEDGYANSAALFARDGSLAGRYDKSFLWHFDARWFVPGHSYSVFETDVGRIGMLICADGRLPEIARSLTLNGAQIILDLTAWVSGGRSAAELSTVQREYLMPVRAAENGVWMACADKFGVEAESIVYCGRSCVIDPSGNIVAELGPNDDATLFYDVPITDAVPPIARRPELYSPLVQPTPSLPVVRTLDEPMVMQENEHRIAAVQMTMPASLDEFLPLARAHLKRLALHDADLALFPATPGKLHAAYPLDAVVESMAGLAAESGVVCAFTGSEGDDGIGRHAFYLVGPDGVIGRHYQSHNPADERFGAMPLGDQPSPILNTRFGRIGLMVAAEGYSPEVARSMMLRGAEIILWSADSTSRPMMQFARARADENRVFVACAAAPSASGATAIIDPTGRVLAQALEGRELSVTATVNRALSHLKAMAPNTDVVRNRQPGTYSAITRELPAGERVV